MRSGDRFVFGKREKKLQNKNGELEKTLKANQ